MAFVKQHKHKLQAAAIFAGTLLVFALLWFFVVQAWRQNTLTLPLHTARSAQTDPAAGVYTQSFSAPAPFAALGLARGPFPAPAPINPSAAPALRVYDGAGKLLGRATAVLPPAQEREENIDLSDYYFFRFDASLSSSDGRYVLEVEPHGAVFAQSMRSANGWQLRRDGYRQAGTLGIAMQTAPIGGFLAGAYWLFAALCAAALAGLFLAARAGWPLHKLFAVTAACLGLLYCMVLPPYSAPDEQFHINQTFNISSAMLGQGPWQVVWGYNYKRAADTDGLVEDHVTTPFTYQRLAARLFEGSADDASTRFTGEEVGGYSLLYWPAAAAVSLCRLLGLGFVPTLYAGRLVNLALYVLLCALAVRLAPFGKGIFAAVPLLPMSLHLAASYSRDCPTIALYLFYIALCLRYTFTKERIFLRDVGLLVLISFLAAPAKAVYALLLPLCLAIPSKKLQWRGRPANKKLAVAALALVVCIGAGSFYWQSGGDILLDASATVELPEEFYYGAQGIGDGTGGPPTALQLAQAGINPDDVRFILPDFFTQPGTIIKLCLRTLAQNTTFYLQTMLGGIFSYFDLPVSWLWVLALAVWLVLATLPAPGALRPPPLWRGYAGLLVLAAAGAVVVGCIVWTPTHYTTIYGVQGRYFLPILPLALCAAAPLWKTLRPTRNMESGVLCGGAVLALGTLANAALVILGR